MNAEQMFERLGYTRNLDSKKLIYTKALKGMFRYFEITFDLTDGTTSRKRTHKIDKF